MDLLSFNMHLIKYEPTDFEKFFFHALWGVQIDQDSVRREFDDLGDGLYRFVAPFFELGESRSGLVYLEKRVFVDSEASPLVQGFKDLLMDESVVYVWAEGGKLLDFYTAQVRYMNLAGKHMKKPCVLIPSYPFEDEDGDEVLAAINLRREGVWGIVHDSFRAVVPEKFLPPNLTRRT